MSITFIKTVASNLLRDFVLQFQHSLNPKGRTGYYIAFLYFVTDPLEQFAFSDAHFNYQHFSLFGKLGISF